MARGPRRRFEWKIDAFVTEPIANAIAIMAENTGTSQSAVIRFMLQSYLSNAGMLAPRHAQPNGTALHPLQQPAE